jgi:penicillin-binding protein-related factor A (putative recombinase)
MKGISDILGVVQGRMIAIEVKKPTTEVAAKTYATRAQKDFLAKVRANGGHGLVARSVQDVEEFLLVEVDYHG